MSNQADTERIQTPPSEEDPGFDGLHNCYATYTSGNTDFVTMDN